MARINDLTTFPNTTPALDDHVLGTDVSDTANSADGESVTFRIDGILGVMGTYAYDYQEFTSDGTWSKPSSAASTDKVLVIAVGGGGGPGNNTGGQGGGGGYTFFDMGDLSSSEGVVVGSGGGGNTSGGNSEFGTSGSNTYVIAYGGTRGNDTPTTVRFKVGESANSGLIEYNAGSGASSGGNYGIGFYSGRGGENSATSSLANGRFPGGGGGWSAGAGAGGVVRVYSIKGMS